MAVVAGCAGRSAAPEADPSPINGGSADGLSDGRTNGDGLPATTDADGGRLHYRASSALAERANEPCRFSPAMAGDGRADTCWAEGAPGDGAGEWLEVILPARTLCRGFRIIAGFARDEETRRANGRPAEITFQPFREDEGLEIITLPLADTGEVQEFPWGCESFYEITRVRITITKAYAGEKYDDTCISEIELF